MHVQVVESRVAQGWKIYDHSVFVLRENEQFQSRRGSSKLDCEHDAASMSRGSSGSLK